VKRREFVLARARFSVVALALTTLALPSLALDSPAALKRLVIVKCGDGKFPDDVRKRWIQVFREEGLVDGRDAVLQFEERIGGSPHGNGPWTLDSEQRAREIIATRPAGIMACGSKIHLFKSLTQEVPLIFYGIGWDPVEWGLVQSYSRPGGNLTGAAFPEMQADGTYAVDEKLLDLLRELRPLAKRVGRPYGEDELRDGDPSVTSEIAAWKKTMSKRGLEYVQIALPKDPGPAVVIDAIRRAKIDLLLFYRPMSPEVRDFLVGEHIPFSGGDIYHGGLVYFYASFDENLLNAAKIAVKVVRGADPATIPVRFPTRYYTRINLNTAREMGLIVPPSVLMQADEVIDINPRSAR